MDNNNLTVGTEVLEQMAAIAAKEVEGVAGLADKTVDIRGAVSGGKLFKSAVATQKNGAITIDIHIKIKDTSNAKIVAEAVQKNIKDKLQNMTGSAITHVNVVVADICFEENK